MKEYLQSIEEPWDNLPPSPLEEISHIFLGEGGGSPPHTPQRSSKFQQVQPTIPPWIQNLNMVTTPRPLWLTQDAIEVPRVVHDFPKIP